MGTFTNQARTSRAPSCGHSDVTGDDPVASTLDITRYIQTLSSNAGSGLGGHATCNDMPNNGASVVAADYAAVGAAGVLKSRFKIISPLESFGNIKFWTNDLVLYRLAVHLGGWR